MAHGIAKFTFRTVEAILLVAFLSAAFLAWRLSRGPLPLDLLTPYIEKSLAGGQSDFRISIGRAVLRWQELTTAPVITVESVQAIDRSGIIAALPRMDVEMSLPAMIRGDLVPEEISLSSPSLRVTRRADGSFAFGVTQTPNPEGNENEPVAAALIGALTQPAGDANRAGYLQRIAVRDSTFVLRDEASGRRWVVPKATLILQRAGEDVELTATLPVIDQDHPWNASARGRYRANAHELDLSLKLDGFRPASISELAAQLHPLRAADLGVSGQVSARFALLNEAARLEQMKFDLHGDDGVIRLPQPVERAYKVRKVGLKGDISDGLDHILLENLHVELNDEGGSVINVTGEGIALNTAPLISLEIGVDNLTTEALKAMWPEGAKENTRQWVSANLHGGTLSRTHFHIGLSGDRLENLALTELNGESNLAGLAVTYMKTMPRVERTNGKLEITQGLVTCAISDGYVPDTQTGKGLRVRGGMVRLTELGTDHERARINLDLAGDLGEVMRLIDHEPLGYATSMGIDPTTPAGATAINLDFTFPLVHDLKLDQLQIAVKAKADGVQIPNIVFNQPLNDGHLNLVVDRKGMDVTGNVVLGGIPARIVWRENFGTGDFRSRYDIDTVLDNAQRKRVALTAPIFAPPYIDGPVRAHVIYTARRDGTSTIEADADLRDAALGVAYAGWAKKASDSARAVVSTVMRKDAVVSVPNFRLITDQGDELAGALQFGADSEISKMTISTARLGETNAAGEMNVDPSGVRRVEAHGKAFDLGSFLKEVTRDDGSGSADASKSKWDVHAKFDRLWMSPEGDFRDVDLTYRQGASGIEHLDFASKVDGTTAFALNLGDENGKRRFYGESASGGAVVRAIGLFDDIVGGMLQIEGEVAPDGAIKGKADIHNFRVVKAPVLARLLSVAALTGIVDELGGKGIGFKLLRAPFSYKNSLLRVSDGEMFGTSLGLTGKGTYNFAARQMDFQGTVIPAYAINNVLSSIPLLGKLLTGGEKGGGVLAATYSYRGDPSTAQPSVNPLAALAPGITRHIFDIFKSPAPQSAQNPPKKKPETPADAAPADG